MNNFKDYFISREQLYQYLKGDRSRQVYFLLFLDTLENNEKLSDWLKNKITIGIDGGNNKVALIDSSLQNDQIKEINAQLSKIEGLQFDIKGPESLSNIDINIDDVIVETPNDINYLNHLIIVVDSDYFINDKKVKTFMNNIARCVDGTIKIAYLTNDNSKALCLLIEHVEGHLILQTICRNLFIADPLPIFYEYKYPGRSPTTNADRIFVEKGYKPVQWDYFCESNTIHILSKNIFNTTKNGTQKKYFKCKISQKEFKSLYYYDFIELTIDESFIKKIDKKNEEEDNNKINKIDINIYLDKDNNITCETLKKLYEDKQKYEKQLNIIERQIRSIENIPHNNYFRNKKVAYFIDSKEINLFLYFFYCLDEEHLQIAKQTISIFSFLKEKKYLIFSPSYLIPNSVIDLYIEDINFSTDKFEIFVPIGKKLFPDISKENDILKIVDKFHEIVKNHSGIDLNNYVLLIKDSNYSELLNKKEGVEVQTFIEKHKELNIISSFNNSVKIDNFIFNQYDYQRTNVDDCLNKAIKDYDTVIINDIEEITNKAMQNWNDTKKRIEELITECPIDKFEKQVKTINDTIVFQIDNKDIIEQLQNFNKAVVHSVGILESILNQTDIVDLENNHKDLLIKYDTMKFELERMLENLNNKNSDMETFKSSNEDKITNSTKTLKDNLESLKDLNKQIEKIWK